ncbi:MAG: hypothetical protein M3Z66_16340 [Chloroflexota bacterium]|nr:hypothetical protein [Chloroflexota bacterium]
MSDLHQLGLLFRLRMRLAIRAMVSRYTRKSRRVAPIRLAVGVLILGWVLITLVVPMSYFLAHFLSRPGSRAEIGSWLELGSSLSLFVTFFYAFVTLIGTMTYRSDLSLLLLTPVSPRVILTEKLLGVSLGFTPLLLVTLPSIFAVGRVFHLGLLFDLLAVALIVIGPIIPVSLALLLLLPVLRFLPPSRARTIGAALGMVSGAGIYIGSQLLVSRPLSAGGSIIPPTVPAALPSTWPGHALAAVTTGDVSGAFLFSILTLLLAGGLFSLAVILSARLLATGSATYHEVMRRQAKRGVPNPEYRRIPPRTQASLPVSTGGWRWLIVKEWMVLRRDPTRLMQLGYPLLIIGFSWYRLLATPSLAAHHSAALEIIPLFIVLTLATVLFVNTLAPSIVNREGRSLYLLALAPLTPRSILLAKWLVCIIPALVLIEALLLGTSFMHHLPVSELLLTGLVLAGLIVALSGLMICLNLLWPRLRSENPRKQASLLAVLVGTAAEFIVAGAVLGLLVVALALQPTLSLVAGGALCLAALILGSIIGGVLLAGPVLLGNLLTRDTVTR